MQIGAVAVVAGLALAGLADGRGNRLGLGLGALAVLGGAALGLWPRRARPGVVPHRGAAEIDLLIRAMAAVAGADRRLDPGEVAMIEDVLAGLLGAPLPRARITRALRQMAGKNALEGLAKQARDLPPEAVDLAVKGAVWAGWADGTLAPAERRKVEAVAAALGVTGHRLRRCIAEADHVRARLAAQENRAEG
jgi:uncharacterized tellurite resistance protein B-like protein